MTEARSAEWPTRGRAPGETARLVKPGGRIDTRNRAISAVSGAGHPLNQQTRTAPQKIRNPASFMDLIAHSRLSASLVKTAPMFLSKAFPLVAGYIGSDVGDLASTHLPNVIAVQADVRLVPGP